MFSRLNRAHRTLSVTLGVVTLCFVAAVLVSDALPSLSHGKSHDVLAAVSLGMIAVAYLFYQAAHRPGWREWVKAVLLAIAFLLWAANQVVPEPRVAILCNDLAIALFILDVFLVIVGWPPSSPDESFAETFGRSDLEEGPPEPAEG